ncbi:hypothetical protein BKA66DRAFT_602216 [Pyrenochaeta sp. MPI-SDFR-AT-0127]|nr:hypothetical protein BKA66DRAFT_602216 [Pyrenochaeta sp. MPI-SDFR-AT-0127]
MSLNSPPHESASQTRLSSSFAHAPNFPPPTFNSSNASPPRKPLHERSNSQSNQFSGPTIRIVQDPDDAAYSKYPIPSEPSQILPPPRHAPGYGFERPGSRVSSGSQVANTIAKFEASRTRVPQPVLSRKKGFRHSVSTSASEADTLVASSFSPSSLRFSQGSTPPSSPPPEINDFEKALEVLEEETPSLSQRPTIRAVPLPLLVSAASFASTVPAASPHPISNAGNPSSVSADQPSSPGHYYSSSTESEKGRPSFVGNTDYRQPVLKTSTESFAYSDISYTSIEPTYTQPPSQPSPTLHEARTATFASGTRLHYPIVRAPSASGLRSESRDTPTIASRMQDRSLVHQWSSQLSTIPSVSERDSRSLARGSLSFGARSHSQDSYVGNGRTYISRRRGQTVGSAQSSSDNVSSEGHTEFSAVPRPLFSPVSRASTEERDYHGEHLDTISPLPTSVPLRMKNSGYLQRHNSDAGSTTDSRPSSSQSNISTFIHNTIPAWARVYYQRGERISMGAPESESSGSIRLGTSHSGRTTTPLEGNFPLSIYRPRNRPRNRASQPDTISLSDDIQPIDGNVYVLGPNMHPLSGYSTPHLRTDRRGLSRYSAWKAPSLDDDLNSTLLGRQNRQILLFCVGFIFPLAWMIASVLPLPLDPNLAETPSQANIEQQFAQAFGPADDKAFQKATWWRNLNRIMSGIGTLLIGVIIALAILASRMS